MYGLVLVLCVFFFCKQKTAYEMRISDWSSDVCSSDLHPVSIEPAHMGRSSGSEQPTLPGIGRRRPEQVAAQAQPALVHAELFDRQREPLGQQFSVDALAAHAADRKSTRLNSSH